MTAVDILIAIVALPCLLFIPGFVTFRAFKVHKIESLKLSFFEATFLQILASIAITGWVAFIITEAGCFSLWLLIAIVGALSFLILVIFHRDFKRPSFSKPKFNLQSVFLTLLIIMAGFLFFHPSEEIIGRHDIGIYISTGVNIANTGSIETYDPIIEKMPDHIRDTFYLMSENPTTYQDGAQFPDFVIEDKESGAVIPWRLPLQQIWFAIFYSIFGLEGALYSQPLCAILSVLTIFLLCRNLWNWRVGAIASTLLSVSFIQIFFAQYSSPEMLFQLLAFNAIFSFILFLRTSNGFFGALSALCFGQLMMARLDAVLIFIPIVILMLYLIFLRGIGKTFLYFLIPFFIVWFHSLLHINYFCMSFIDATVLNIQTVQGMGITRSTVQSVILGISIVVMLLAVLGIFYSEKIPRINSVRKRVVGNLYKPRFITFIILLLVVYLLITSPNRELTSWMEKLIVFPRDFDTMFALSWFIGWFGLLLALVGIVFMIFEKSYIENYIFIGIISLTVFAFLLTLANNPIFPWGMRRTIPILLPTIMVFIGYGLDRVRDLMFAARRHYDNKILITNVITILLILVLFIPAISMDRTLIKPQFDGYIKQVSQVADFFTDDSIIIDDCRATDVTLSMPLKYIFNKQAIYLFNDLNNADEFAEMVEIWKNEGKEVYLLVLQGKRLNYISQALSGKIQFEHAANFTMQISRIEWETRSFSNKRLYSEIELEVYRLSPL